MKTLIALSIFGFTMSAHGKTFQNSYVSFEVPDNWTCLQEGVAWTCTPSGPIESKEAVIVLASKVAGPEDNLYNFLNYLKQPKKIPTRVGTPMPSSVAYAQERVLAGHKWIQAQHVGSEIQEFMTLYLATVKDQLAILVSFSAEQSHYRKYNPVFDKAMKTLKIVASNQLLFPKNKVNNNNDVLGIQVLGNTQSDGGLLPPPERRKKSRVWLYLLGLGVVAIGGVYWLFTARKKISHSKSGSSKTK